MRIAKTDTFAGLPAPLARSLVELFRGGTYVQEVADNLFRQNGFDDADAGFACMATAGYLMKVDTGGLRPRLVGGDHPGQCPGHGQLWKADQWKDGGP